MRRASGKICHLETINSGLDPYECYRRVKGNKYLAGVRLSSVPAPRTLTAILTGFRSPTRTIWSTASLTLALNSPVRLCFGSRPRIFWRSSLNPRSSRRSASSRTSTSNEDCGQWTCGEESSSSSLPGVDMRRFGERLRKTLRSCAGVVVPPSSNWGMTVSTEERYGLPVSGSNPGSLPSSWASFDAEGPWKARSERSTV